MLHNILSPPAPRTSPHLPASPPCDPTSLQVRLPVDKTTRASEVEFAVTSRTLKLTLVRCDTNGRCEVGSSTARLADDESYRSMERM